MENEWIFVAPFMTIIVTMAIILKDTRGKK
jgi:hypothetical protein